MRNASLANPSTVEEPFTYRRSTVITERKNLLLHRPSLIAPATGSDPASIDGATDIMAGFQLPLSVDMIKAAVPSTLAPGALALQSVVAQNVGGHPAIANVTVTVNSFPLVVPSSASVIEDRLIELLHHSLWYVSSVEVLAGSACFIGLCWLLHRCVLKRPRLCLAVIVTWLLLFCFDLLLGRGPTAGFKDVVHRSNVAVQSSRDLAQSVVKCLVAWLSLFMPVLVDVAGVAAASWKQLTPRQRVFACVGVVVAYAVLATVRAIRKHSRKINKIAFQAAFLVIGPSMWILSGSLSSHGLQWLLRIAISGAPTLLSCHAACRGCAKQDKHPFLAKLPIVFWTQEEWVELWISFWACWPVLMLLKVAIQRMPQLFPDSTSSELPLPSELERGLIVFAVWLQFWQGSLLLTYSIRSILRAVNSEICAVPIACLSRLASAMPARPHVHTVVEVGNSMFQNRNIGNLVKIVFVCVIAGSVMITWTFYHTFRIACDVIASLTVCFAAVDSANIVLKRTTDFYVPRLSFWVLLQLWRTMSLVPFVGSGLSLVTPVAIGLFFLAGDTLLQWIVIPLMVWVESLPKALVSMVVVAARGAPLSARQHKSSDQLKGKDECEETLMTAPNYSSKTTNWQLAEQSLFNMIVGPAAKVFGISNMKAVLAVKAALRGDTEVP